MKRIKIEYLPIEQVIPADYNPRDVSEQELDGLRKSIARFGGVEPLVFNQQTGNLCGGHQRLKVYQMLGYDEVPVVNVDLDHIEEKALNLALNNHAIQGKFNPEMVHTIIEEIRLEMPELVEELRFDILEKDLKISFPFTEKISPESYEDKNKEINTDNFGNDLQHACPKCGFEFNE